MTVKKNKLAIVCLTDVVDENSLGVLEAADFSHTVMDVIEDQATRIEALEGLVQKLINMIKTDGVEINNKELKKLAWEYQ